MILYKFSSWLARKTGYCHDLRQDAWTQGYEDAAADLQEEAEPHWRHAAEHDLEYPCLVWFPHTLHTTYFADGEVVKLAHGDKEGVYWQPITVADRDEIESFWSPWEYTEYEGCD